MKLLYLPPAPYPPTFRLAPILLDPEPRSKVLQPSLARNFPRKLLDMAFVGPRPRPTPRFTFTNNLLFPGLLVYDPVSHLSANAFKGAEILPDQVPQTSARLQKAPTRKAPALHSSSGTVPTAHWYM